jgi:tRNA (guanine-N7-)-methyltransferase
MDALSLESSGNAGNAAKSAFEKRTIRSFVRREGRLSDAQARHFEAMMGKIGVPYAPAFLDLDALFGRCAPKILEIGFGMGEASAIIAGENPQNDYLGIEVHTPGVGSLCKRVAEAGLANLRIVQHDAFEVLRDMIAPRALSGIHIFFPDPWPKTRHHKRRLIQPRAAAIFADRLEPGGYIHCATDWEDYALQMVEVFSAEPKLQNAEDADPRGFVPRPEYRPQTKFESRGLSLGYGVWDVIFHRADDQS